MLSGQRYWSRIHDSCLNLCGCGASNLKSCKQKVKLVCLKINRNMLSISQSVTPLVFNVIINKRSQPVYLFFVGFLVLAKHSLENFVATTMRIVVSQIVNNLRFEK